MSGIGWGDAHVGWTDEMIQAWNDDIEDLIADEQRQDQLADEHDGDTE